MDVPRKNSLYCVDPAHAEAALAAHLRRHRLLDGVHRLGLAVSGGADSVALLLLMRPLCREAGIAVTVLHFNHGLRPESEEEERFVRGLAAQNSVPVLCEKSQAADLQRKGVSLEMAAREARLAFFERCRASAGLDAVATGHQADDVAESLLLRLARGSGAAGLSGLRPRSQTQRLLLLRPLLAISGAALRGWLRQRNQEWREDASNRDPAIPRNRVRHAILPYLESAWVPDLRARLCRSAEALREDDLLLEELAAEKAGAVCRGGSVATAPLLSLPLALQRRILRQWLFRQQQPEAAGLETVAALLDACASPGDWKVALPGGAFAACSSALLSVARAPDFAPPPPARVPFSGTVRWGDFEIATEAGHGFTPSPGPIGTCPAACSLSLEALEGQELVVRARQPGDHIAPTGLSGSKKIQDVLTDAKVPERLRDTLPLFACGDEIAWVPGYRVSRLFAVPAPEAPSLHIRVSRCAEGA